MALNYVDIALAAMFVIFICIGYHKGIFITVINFIRYALGFAICFFCSSNLAEPVYNSYVAPAVLSMIDEKIVTTTNLDEVLTNLDEFKQSLPMFISDKLGTDSLTIPKADDIGQVILDEVFAPVLLPLTKGFVFIVVFLLFFISTGLLVRLIKGSSEHHEKKRREKGKGTSVLKKSDRIFGALLGVVKAAVLLMAITSILVYVAEFNASGDSTFVTQINESILVEFISGFNPFNAITYGLL